MKVTLKDSLQSLVVTGKFKGMSVHGSLLADECMCSFYAARQERVQGTEGALALVQWPAQLQLSPRPDEKNQFRIFTCRDQNPSVTKRQVTLWKWNFLVLRSAALPLLGGGGGEVQN